MQIAGIIFQTRSRVSYCTYRVKEVLPTKKGGGRITAEILAETGLSQDGHRQISQGSPSWASLKVEEEIILYNILESDVPA